MGGLRKYMPVTYWTCLVGTLALLGFPGLSGFFSKDIIIEAIKHSDTEGHTYAYWCVLIGVFVTALYSFRLVFYAFHGKERFREPAPHAHGGHGDHGHDDHARVHEPHESPWVVTVPLILLAIPSIFAGALFVGPIVFGGYFGESIVILPQHDGLAQLAKDFHGAVGMIAHGFFTLPFWLVTAGIVGVLIRGAG